MNKKVKIILGALALTAFAVICLTVYRVFFEFKNSKVRSYIQAEASQYADKEAAYKIIHEAVQHILKSSDLTNQVRTYADAGKLERERVLVDTAILQCKKYNYLA